MALSGFERYRRNLRTNATALWKGTWTPQEFEQNMLESVDKGFMNAWEEGAAEVGVLPGEFTDEEMTALYGFLGQAITSLTGLTEYVKANSKANKGKLATVLNRIDLWAQQYKAVASEAKTRAGANIKLRWNFGATEDHCFIAGTMILTKTGERPIETIEVGDLVWTRIGWRPVTETHRHEHKGHMMRIKAGGRWVTATPEHRIWTQRGWVEIRNLRIGEDTVAGGNWCKKFADGAEKLSYSAVAKCSLVSATTTTVYNLSVAEVPEYVANGILSHNCRDCERYDKRVYRAATWARYDIRPQSPKLACHGYRCDCRLTPTNEPANKGRPPRMTG